MPIIADTDFLSWEQTAPDAARRDPAWRFDAYRVSLYVLDRVRVELPGIRRDAGAELADQLLRSIASISANIGEGLGRPTPIDRARFIGIALGSLRESFTWYQAAASAFPRETLELRLNELGELRSLLLGYQRWLSTKDEKCRLI
jgi:four helix bundle protein